MIMKKTSLIFVSALIVAPFVILSLVKHHVRSNIADGKLSYDIIKSASQYNHESPFDTCTHPIVFRKAIKFNDDKNCQSNPNTDHCRKFIQQRMVDVWGDRFVEAFSGSYIPKHENNSYYESKIMPLKEFFNNDDYADHLIRAMHQLGDSQEYSQFFTFDNNDDISINHYDKIRHMPSILPIETQFFLAHEKGSGSALHFAFGLNTFVMLAGRKRWLLIHPAFIDDAHCAHGMSGIYGDCVPNGYLPPQNNVSLDMYKKILIDELNIPENAIIDVVLEPGDILINCPLWIHTIENLDDFTIGTAFRGSARQTKFDVIGFEAWIRAIWESLKTKFWHGDFEKFTLIDAFKLKNKLAALDEPRPEIFDEAKNKDGNSFINAVVN